jgi:hypothetical protein
MKPFDYPFEAAGKKYTLRYSFQARRSFERKTKKSVPGMLKRLTEPETQTADELIDMFLLLLSTSHPDVTADEVGNIIDDLGGDDAAMVLLSEALSSQMPAGAVNPQ